MGPKAPKDAEKQRSWFYIMQGKEVFGQEIGGGFIHPIYEDNGRLISSAKICGNIDDESMLNLLTTAKGFRKLVHSIGVSAEMDAKGEKIGFAFQMYGKNDVYGGGATFTGEVECNAAETRIYLSDFPEKEDEFQPGQIRFIFKEKGQLARVSVRLYLNDGFTAPEPVEDYPVDVTSDNYKEMIRRSLMNKGNLARLKTAMDKAANGEDVTVAYIGGSITQGAGATPLNKECYAFKSFKGFLDVTGAGENVHYVKAGVGGTPSQLGVIRFERDIVRNSAPDVVVIEFAVNDEGDETKGDCFESLVRKALMLPSKPAVIILFAVFANDWNLQERLSPVGYLYDLPMVSVLDAVSPQFMLKPDNGRVVSKNSFFYDCFHPTNIGHTIMADCITNLLMQVENTEYIDKTEELLKQSPVKGKTFENCILIDRIDNNTDAIIDEGDFSGVDTMLQNVELDLDAKGSPEFPNNWMFEGKSEAVKPFTMSLECKSLMVVYKDSGELNVGKALAIVDDETEFVLDPHVNGWVHCNPLILIKSEEKKKHTIVIKPVDGEENKSFTILGFAVTK